MFIEEEDNSRLLGRIYDAAGDPTLWAPFIEELARRTPIRFCRAVGPSTRSRLVLSVEFLEGAGGVRSRLPGVLPRLGCLGRCSLPNPREYSGGYVCTSQALCPLPQPKKTEFYNDSLVHGGIEHGIFALLENSKFCVASVCLYRDRHRVRRIGAEDSPVSGSPPETCF